MRRLPASLLFLALGGTLVAGTAALAAHNGWNAAAVGLPFSSSSTTGTGVLGNGTIRTFVDVDSAGRPSAVGAIFTAGVLENLPATGVPLSLSLGPDASRTPFTHLYVDWVPMGHAPGGVYDRPHIDFHFYFSPVWDRLATAAGVDSQPPAPGALPVGYFKVTESVAFMGTHYADSAGPEFHGAPFEKVFLYGSHEGKITFYDFMATRAWLVNKPNLVIRIKQPVSYPTHGYYPTEMHVNYDSATATYRVALEQFVSH